MNSGESQINMDIHIWDKHYRRLTLSKKVKRQCKSIEPWSKKQTLLI